MADNQYPFDEFDNLAQERVVGGAHRKKKSTLGWWIALVAVIVLSPLAGWGIVNWADARDAASSSSASASASASDTSSASASEENTASASATAEASTADASQSPSETATTEASPQPVLSSRIDILNGSGVTGLARSKQEILKNAGYANVSIANWNASTPRQSTVYYAAGSEVTARAVAQALGLNTSAVVAADTDLDGRQIRVILRTDAS